LKPKNDWKGLSIIGFVESEREEKGKDYQNGHPKQTPQGRMGQQVFG
jgi:hypothetical protein